MTNENAYATPEAELVELDVQNNNEYFTVAISKMLVLSIITLNLYNVYWMYKNWQLQKLHANYNCIPVLRAIFQIFFTHSLFVGINETAKIKGHKVTWNAALLATIYIALLILGNLADRIWPTEGAFTLAVFVPMVLPPVIAFIMIPVQKTINQLNGDPKGLENHSFNWANWLVVVFGVIFWILMVVGILAIAGGIRL